MDALEPEPLRLSAGQYIGNYRLTRPLGSGAYANIYLGEHRYLQTRAAVKVSRRQLTRGQRERFLKEAQIAARLVHPQIIRILEFGIEQGIPYLVMDYAAQGSLRQRHSLGARLEREQILEYAWDIADALEYIHERHYIHRDLKPENLLIGSHGEILVSDFGIAIAVQDTHNQPEQEIIGTLPYMAPEQIAGHPCLASDLYALGVIIYEWICGELPFDEEAFNLAWLHLNAQPPSLCTQVPDLPTAVERVVLRALAKDPARRFSSVVAFVEQLEMAWTTAQVLARRPVSFYRQTTYHTDTPGEIAASVLNSSDNKKASTHSPISERKHVWKTWKDVSFVFALDLMLCMFARICIPGTSWSPLWIGVAIAIGGLPIAIGCMLNSRRTLTMAGLALALEIICFLLWHEPLAVISAAIAGTALCALIALAAFIRFLN